MNKKFLCLTAFCLISGVTAKSSDDYTGPSNYSKQLELDSFSPGYIMDERTKANKEEQPYGADFYRETDPAPKKRKKCRNWRKKELSKKELKNRERAWGRRVLPPKKAKKAEKPETKTKNRSSLGIIPGTSKYKDLDITSLRSATPFIPSVVKDTDFNESLSFQPILSEDD